MPLIGKYAGEPIDSAGRVDQHQYDFFKLGKTSSRDWLRRFMLSIASKVNSPMLIKGDLRANYFGVKNIEVA